jgi:hypothetical protein
MHRYNVHVGFHDGEYKQIIVPNLEPSCSTESAVSRTTLSLRDCTSGFLGSRYLFPTICNVSMLALQSLYVAKQ